MPISRSSKKSLRKSVKNRKVNVGIKSKFREVIKKFLVKPTQEGANEAFSAIDKAMKAGLLHKNKVAHVKSQLSKKIGKEVVKTVVKKAAKKKVVKKVAKKNGKKAVK